VPEGLEYVPEPFRGINFSYAGIEKGGSREPPMDYRLWLWFDASLVGGRHMKFRLIAAFAAVAALSSCQSESPAKGKTLAAIEAQCTAYGFKPGTDVYAACVYQSDQNRINQNRNARLRFAAALAQTGQQMQENASNQAMVNAMNRPRTCYTTGYGSTLTTRCY